MATELIPTKLRPVSLSESQALVERIAGSTELRRAARLRTFLIYVCEQTLNHGASVIHEQEIGAAIFGRPASYDTGIDNIVRVNATELRKRLEHYFAEEGAAEEVVLEIQRGSYTPVFRRRALSAGRVDAAPEPSAFAEPRSQAAAPLMAKIVAVEVPGAQGADAHPVAGLPKVATAAAAKGRGGSRLRWWQLAAVLSLAGCGYLGWQLHLLTMKVEPWKRQPALRAFWGEFFNSGTDTDVLLADTSLAVAEDMMQRQVALADYLNYKYKRFAEEPSLTGAQRSDLALVLERNNGSNADFRAGQEILALNPYDLEHLTLKFAREYTPEAAKQDSLVLIGSRQSNPWVSLFADKLNFDLAYDPVLRRPYVVNRAPLAGELASYPSSGDREGSGIGYALIAYLPGLSGRSKTLIIEGSDSQATEAAGDFVIGEESMRLLEQKFAKGKIPFFEVLLRTSQLNGTPLHGEVIAYRTYPGDH